MSERVVVKKGERSENLSWRWTIRDGKKEVHFTCRCGASGPFTEHLISPEGHITPSIHHDDGECNFHSFITLEGYINNGS